MKEIGTKRVWEKLETKKYEILRISGHSCPKWETFGFIIDFSIVICCSHRHCKFSCQPLPMRCFHCPKSCEMCYSDDDKKNRGSNMRRRIVWYKITKTSDGQICNPCHWMNQQQLHVEDSKLNITSQQSHCRVNWY